MTRVPLASGLGLNVLEWEAPGPDGDHTVLVLHGFLDFACSFVPFIEAGLAERFHVLAPDLRGHGDSDRVGPGGFYHFSDYLADLHDLLHKKARKRLSIVGHSMGGMIASFYAGTFPEQVSRLCMIEGIGPPYERKPFGPDRVASWIHGAERIRRTRQSSYATVEDAAARLVAHDPLLDPALALRLAERGTTRDASGRHRFKHDAMQLTRSPYHGYQHETAMRFWRRIACPTLLIDGEISDFNLPPEELARRLAGFAHAERATIPGASHMMHRQKPVELAAMVRAFLTA